MLRPCHGMLVLHTLLWPEEIQANIACRVFTDPEAPLRGKAKDLSQLRRRNRSPPTWLQDRKDQRCSSPAHTTTTTLPLPTAGRSGRGKGEAQAVLFLGAAE